MDVATDEAGYAQPLHREGHDRAAEALFRRAIETHRRWRPDGHPRAMLGLGELLLDRGHARATEPYFRDALRSFRAKLPPTHPSVDTPSGHSMRA